MYETVAPESEFFPQARQLFQASMSAKAAALPTPRDLSRLL